MRLAWATVALLALGSPSAAAATLVAGYSLSWAGFEVGELEVELAEQTDGYSVAWRGGTVGLVGRLYPFTSSGRSEGRRIGDRFISERYLGRSRWDDGGGTWMVAFDRNGRASRLELSPEQMVGRDPVPEALRVAPDPAALALTAIAAAAPGVQLAGASFDGKRATHFDLRCADAEAEPERMGELSCTVAGRLLAGASQASRERRGVAGRREPVQVWLAANVRESGWWPIRIEAPTRAGTVTGRLVRAERRSHIGG